MEFADVKIQSSLIHKKQAFVTLTLPPVLLRVSKQVAPFPDVPEPDLAAPGTEPRPRNPEK